MPSRPPHPSRQCRGGWPARTSRSRLLKIHLAADIAGTIAQAERESDASPTATELLHLRLSNLDILIRQKSCNRLPKRWLLKGISPCLKAALVPNTVQHPCDRTEALTFVKKSGSSRPF
jgi:hypothetical protein